MLKNALHAGRPNRIRVFTRLSRGVFGFLKQGAKTADSSGFERENKFLTTGISGQDLTFTRM